MIVGYFSSPEQAQPAHDPGLAVPCPVCRLPLHRPLKTISLMLGGDTRSYFFRTHQACWDNAPAERREAIEGGLVDLLVGLRAVGENT